MIGVEIRRIAARRLVRALLLLAVVAFLVAGVISYFATAGDAGPGETGGRTAIQECAAVPVPAFSGNSTMAPPPSLPPQLQERCEQSFTSDDPRFHYTELVSILSQGIGVPLLMLGWLLGASFIGAEWHHRMMTTTLTWESRRTLVLLSKAGAAAIVVFVAMIVLQGVLAGALYPAAAAHGTVAGINGAWASELAGTVARVAGLAALASVMGAAVATIGRNTAAAFGAGFIYLSAVEGLVRGLKPQWSQWLLGDNIGLVLLGGEEVGLMGRSQVTAGMLLLAYTGGLLLVALAFFKARDVN